MKQVRLNRLELWIADHAAPIFLAVAALIILGAIAVFWTYQKQGDTAEQVQVIAPQVTKVSRAICDQQSLDHADRATRCAERIRVGLVHCRQVSRCRAAFLALLTYPPPARGATSRGSHTTSTPSTGDTGGGGAQQPKGNQQPSPGSQPGQGGGQGNGHGGGHSPPAETTPGAPQGGSGGDRPADTGGGQGGGDSGAQGGSSSGAGVELCVPRVTCIEAGLPDLDPKGLLP